MATFNWNDLQQAAEEAGGGEPLPANDYDVEVAESEAVKAKTGKDMLKVRFRVENGPHANRALFTQYVINPENPNALAFFFRNMAAFGLTRDYFATNPSLSQVASAMKGRRARVKVIVSEWQSQDRNEVKATMPPTGGPAAAPTPGILGSTPATPATPSVTPSVPASSTPAVTDSIAAPNLPF